MPEVPRTRRIKDRTPSQQPSVSRSTMSTRNKQNEGTSAQPEEPSVSTHDATGSNETANVLDSPASEGVVHSRSDSPPAPSVASPQPRASPKQAGEQDTLDAPAPPSTGGRSGGCKARPRGLPADIRTRSPPTTRDRRGHHISRPVRDLQSPALSQSPNVSTTDATSSGSTAGRGRLVSNSWRSACIIWFILLGLVIAGIGLVCVADGQSLSVGVRKSIELASQAGLGVASAYAAVQHAGGRFYQRLPALHAPRRPSSREAIGSGLGETYTVLSQAVAARNLLHDAPVLILQKRAEVMRFQLPDGSLILKDLALFLRQTRDTDGEMLAVLLRMYQVSRLALRQHSLTHETLSSIQRRDEYLGTYGPVPFFDRLRTYVVGTSTQEAELQGRLKDHIALLHENIVETDTMTHYVLQKFYDLALTTKNIREKCLREDERLLSVKGGTVRYLNWMARAAVQLHVMPEPKEAAEISRNVQRANHIYEWSKGTIKLLEQITIHLKDAKVQTESLIEILRAGGTLTWTREKRNAELTEFLAQISEGFALFAENSAAWDQLRLLKLKP